MTHPNDRAPELDETTLSQVVEVCLPSFAGLEHIRMSSFPPGAHVGQVSCLECEGSGWWGYGPEELVNGPCITCKGTGRIWVGLA